MYISEIWTDALLKSAILVFCVHFLCLAFKCPFSVCPIDSKHIACRLFLHKGPSCKYLSCRDQNHFIMLLSVSLPIQGQLICLETHRIAYLSHIKWVSKSSDTCKVGAIMGWISSSKCLQRPCCAVSESSCSPSHSHTEWESQTNDIDISILQLENLIID